MTRRFSLLGALATMCHALGGLLEGKTKTKTPSVTPEVATYNRAFEALMSEAKGVGKIQGLSCVAFSEHPLGLSFPRQNPSNIYYVGNPGVTDVSVRGMIRMIAWLVGTQGAPVEYLRIIRVPFPDHGHQIYYEVVGWDYAFVSGGCTDCSGTGSRGKKQMDELFAFLGGVYNLEIAVLTFSSGVGQNLSHQIDEQIYACHEINPFQAVIGAHTFVGGQEIRLSRDGKHLQETYGLPSTTRVLGISPIGVECSCGLGERVPLVFHPGYCPPRRRSLEGHHQLLQMEINGETKEFSGFLFEPVNS